ncbi:hypothetical protein [uncultured Arcobacter sp.]|uniref:putative PDDEXK endonuclease n=1 Tax=uncultured Arcobacter sp. TaxID=165434 RepID=UPI00261EB109|nr:hypothetical protein [uncultured Arcobacter sp.]
MKPQNRKTKGKKYEQKVADYLHEMFYEHNKTYKGVFDKYGNDQLKPRRDSSSGTFNTSVGDIELGLLSTFFPYSIECKHHEDLNLSINSIFKGEIKKVINIYEEQCVLASTDELKPLLVFKANRTKDFCMFSLDYIKNDCYTHTTYLKYDKYIIMLFNDFVDYYLRG